ncbi:hypothetical protein CYFUS_005053 [Cystobacter fuscus]|uniref:Uncharacterized protein n=1 Tax=Cystobacter fuscus TaxID=43 RepID=A0A250J7S6_9BACT|nr:hypothetical protein [Cystobacter fuscus]ATB39608.1 hypothetical protein CYFUS_005053 [Cystobacter fuscus]
MDHDKKTPKPDSKLSLKKETLRALADSEVSVREGAKAMSFTRPPTWSRPPTW